MIEIRTNPVLYLSTERPKFAWYGSTTPNQVKFEQNEFQEVKPRYANIYRWAVWGTMVSGVWCQFLCAERAQNGIRCFLPSEIDKNLSIRSLWQGKVMVIFRFWWNIVESFFLSITFGDRTHANTRTWVWRLNHSAQMLLDTAQRAFWSLHRICVI